MAELLVMAVNLFFEVLIYLLLGRAILSWFIRSPYDSLYKIYMMICNITEPIVAPCRSLTSRFNTGMLDISVLVAFLLLGVARRIIVTLLWLLLY